MIAYFNSSFSFGCVGATIVGNSLGAGNSKLEKSASYIGNLTAVYRWFAIFYIVLVFILIPGIIYTLSLFGQ